jgi:hypothetical protein
MMAQLSTYGIQAILIDSPVLNLIAMQLVINLPCFYIKKLHVIQAVDLEIYKLFRGVSKP